jgi:hypothetical protein
MPPLTLRLIHIDKGVCDAEVNLLESRVGEGRSEEKMKRNESSDGNDLTHDSLHNFHFHN